MRCDPLHEAAARMGPPAYPRVLLHEVATSLALDDTGEFFIDCPVQHTVERPVRFVHVHSTCDITCFWAVPVESRLYLIPKI